ncbi:MULTISPECIES: transcriptional regulator [unclassified Novosphingobium]|uniref:transcriptional regulator n=1 Tax=unclassified Novosphingobium TaxID=2644732 RepID=UPI00135BE803|nr:MULTISPECIES: transcriptional regulator [unclassified Novosphingobium]
MSVTNEELMAFADGEMSGTDAARMAAAIAADPVLAARIDSEQQLRAMLRGHLDPVASEPVPESLSLMIAAAAAEETEQDMIDTPPATQAAPQMQAQPARVLDFAAARARREADAKEAKFVQNPAPRRWGIGAGIAASLVLGLVLGTQFLGGSLVTERNGALVASGSLARGLDTQLASNEPSALRILSSFRREGGEYCRVYDAGATSGIACKSKGEWTLERTMASGQRESGEYRQAGSAAIELMTAAQDMAVGAPLDAAQERAARVDGWGK